MFCTTFFTKIFRINTIFFKLARWQCYVISCSSLGVTTHCLFLACSKILFQASLSIAMFLQFWIFVVPRSCLISTSHLNLNLPILFTAIGLHSVDIVLSLSSLTICPIHVVLCAFAYLILSACWISKPLSSLFLFLEHRSWFLLARVSYSLLLFQTLWIVVHVCLLVRKFSHPYVITALIRLL